MTSQPGLHLMTSTAYEGQSGSKDRGDPEVSVSKLVVYLLVSHS